jgi:hypothetical protein
MDDFVWAAIRGVVLWRVSLRLLRSSPIQIGHMAFLTYIIPHDIFPKRSFLMILP